MHRSPAGQRPLTASGFIQLGEALLRTANALFGTPCETRLIAYNRATGDWTDTPRLADLTDAMFRTSEHVHLGIKPVSEKDATGYVSAHGNHMPAFARLQVLNGGAPQAEINGVAVDVANLPRRIPAQPQPALKTPAQPAGGLVM